MELRQTELSKSSITFIADNYDSDNFDAMLLSRQIACQFKHPIILDYKSSLTNIRLALGLTDRYFRRTLNNAVKFGYAFIEGKNLRLLSKNYDRKHFKRSKKNDYRRTYKPRQLANLVLLQSLYYNQYASIQRKQEQTDLIIHNSVFADRLMPYNNHVKNYAITASCRTVSKKLHLRSTSKAMKLLNELHAAGLITLEKHTQQIPQERAYTLMAKGHRHAVRFNTTKQQFYEVFASTFKLNYSLKRTTPTKWDLLTEQQQVTYLEMGYTKEYINL